MVGSNCMYSIERHKAVFSPSTAKPAQTFGPNNPSMSEMLQSCILLLFCCILFIDRKHNRARKNLSVQGLKLQHCADIFLRPPLRESTPHSCWVRNLYADFAGTFATTLHMFNEANQTRNQCGRLDPWLRLSKLPARIGLPISWITLRRILQPLGLPRCWDLTTVLRAAGPRHLRLWTLVITDPVGW